jgi:formylglycine-generating enzyme required for sulfatase activity
MVINAKRDSDVKRQREIAERQVALFADRYGELMLDFACHAAFPQMLTTELVYLLRQLLQERKDGLELPWSAAPELLLSNLCDTAGYDLYGMSIGIRRVLLDKLVAKFKPERLDELALWMGDYIKHRLEIDSPSRARVLGDPSEWTALACLKSDDEIAQAIKEQLSQLFAETDDPNDRFRLSALVEDHADLLAQRGFQPFKLQDLARKIEDNKWDAPEPEDPIELIRVIMGTNNFPLLQSNEIFYAAISFEETEIESGDALYSLEFETLQVNEEGEIIQREQGRALAFREPLAMDVGLEMVAIPSGKFMMGSPESEPDRWEDESPQHAVTVEPFFIGKYLVTQDQWRTIASTSRIERELNPNPSDFKGDDNRPVENVSWEEAVEFCQRLSLKTGRDYRLPTEAEWEYACRAGSITPFHFGETITTDLANYRGVDDENLNWSGSYGKGIKGIYRQETTPVDTFPPNAFGLYDMHGNVWEWCLDHWHNSYQNAPVDGSTWISNDNNAERVVRGGSWGNDPRDCRSATRTCDTPGLRSFNIGFRVVCEIPRTL